MPVNQKKLGLSEVMSVRDAETMDDSSLGPRARHQQEGRCRDPSPERHRSGRLRLGRLLGLQLHLSVHRRHDQLARPGQAHENSGIGKSVKFTFL